MGEATVRSYRCAICEREVQYEGRLPRTFPFCSERCRMVDLGKWLREQYSIDRDLAPEEFPNSPPESEHRSDAEGGR
jgi:hypothetical protein